jgi:tetratricopeptide (TPR) repeat protein
MEYVKGVPIAEHCDRQRLSTEDRLRLFVQVCEGVQHAHQKGIIHRDLKPSNILVTLQDGRPVPKIIDFGVAKATDHRLTEKTLFTQIGQLIGTPAYMSPEQAEATQQDVDTRTDVYSLGVILYELLVGALPFEPRELRREGYHGMQKIIREKDPSRPSTRVSTLGGESSKAAQNRRTDPASLSRRLRGDLDWITMRSLEKDRSRRYASPNELAADVVRHLDHRPVEAGPPSAGYRFGKFARRHRVGMLAAALVVVAVAAGLTVSLVALAQARTQARTTNQVLDFMLGVFSASNPQVTQGKDITARQLLDTGIKTIDQRLADQPKVRARLKNMIGRVYMAIGALDQSELMLDEALATRRELYGPRHLDVAESLSSRAWLYFYQGKYGESMPLRQEALEILRGELGEDHPQAARALFELATSETELEQYETARRHLEEALDFQERSLEPDDPDIGRTLFQLGWVLHFMGQEGARERLERANEILEKQYGESSPLLAMGLYRLAIVLTKEAAYAEALALHQRTLEINQASFGDDHPAVADSLENLGTYYWYAADHMRSADYWQRALEIRERHLRPDHPDIGSSLNNMALIHRLRGDLEQAHDCMARALEISREALGDRSEGVAHHLMNLGVVVRSMGREDLAERYFKESLAIRMEVFGAESHQVGLILGCLGTLEKERCEFEKAVEYLERALHLRLDVAERVSNLATLAEAYRYLGRMDDAEEMHLRALGEAEEAFGPDHQRTAYPLMGLGKICAVTGRREQASAYHARWDEIFTANRKRDWYYQLCRAGHLALMGDRAAAMDAVRQSMSQGCPSLKLEREPDIDSLRGLPEFKALKSTSKRAL